MYQIVHENGVKCIYINVLIPFQIVICMLNSVGGGGGDKLASFSILNRVKQGGVIPLFVFSLYINELFLLLKRHA